MTFQPSRGFVCVLEGVNYCSCSSCLFFYLFIPLEVNWSILQLPIAPTEVIMGVTLRKSEQRDANFGIQTLRHPEPSVRILTSIAEVTEKYVALVIFFQLTNGWRFTIKFQVRHSSNIVKMLCPDIQFTEVTAICYEQFQTGLPESHRPRCTSHLANEIPECLLKLTVKLAMLASKVWYPAILGSGKQSHGLSISILQCILFPRIFQLAIISTENFN